MEDGKQQEYREEMPGTSGDEATGEVTPGAEWPVEPAVPAEVTGAGWPAEPAELAKVTGAGEPEGPEGPEEPEEQEEPAEPAEPAEPQARPRKVSEMTPAEIGERGENAAAAYLEKSGYDILERNWSCPAGEADIIARDDRCLVFCEVKTRTDISKGLPSEAVDAEKRSRYEKIAAWFIRDYETVDIPIRFDVIGLLVVADDRALMRHYVNAFGMGF